MDPNVLLCGKKGKRKRQKNLKIWVESREGKNIVIAVQQTVSYTAHSSTTDGNVRLAVALCVCVVEGGGGSGWGTWGLPFTNTCYSDYYSVLSIQTGLIFSPSAFLAKLAVFTL